MIYPPYPKQHIYDDFHQMEYHNISDGFLLYDISHIFIDTDHQEDSNVPLLIVVDQIVYLSVLGSVKKDIFINNFSKKQLSDVTLRYEDI